MSNTAVRGSAEDARDIFPMSPEEREEAETTYYAALMEEEASVDDDGT